MGTLLDERRSFAGDSERSPVARPQPSLRNTRDRPQALGDMKTDGRHGGIACDFFKRLCGFVIGPVVERTAPMGPQARSANAVVALK